MPSNFFPSENTFLYAGKLAEHKHRQINKTANGRSCSYWLGLVTVFIFLQTWTCHAKDTSLSPPRPPTGNFASKLFELSLHPHPFQNGCEGNCSFTFYAGKQLDTSLWRITGTRGGLVFPWNYEFGDSGIVAASFSHRMLSIGPYIDIEPELGIGQRFGSNHETEVWAAIYFRWKWFPWNHIIRTTAGISTGFNYASGIGSEILMDSALKGSRLLHFLSPEITFAHPSTPNTEFIIRYHHRSGGKDIFGGVSLFRDVDGGLQYLTFGFRRRY